MEQQVRKGGTSKSRNDTQAEKAVQNDIEEIKGKTRSRTLDIPRVVDYPSSADIQVAVTNVSSIGLDDIIYANGLVSWKIDDLSTAKRQTNLRLSRTEEQVYSSNRIQIESGDPDPHFRPNASYDEAKLTDVYEEFINKTDAPNFTLNRITFVKDVPPSLRGREEFQGSEKVYLDFEASSNRSNSLNSKLGTNFTNKYKLGRKALESRGVLTPGKSREYSNRVKSSLALNRVFTDDGTSHFDMAPKRSRGDNLLLSLEEELYSSRYWTDIGIPTTVGESPKAPIEYKLQKSGANVVL